jgi:hypothetical protein
VTRRWPRQFLIVLAGLGLAASVIMVRLLLDGRAAFRGGIAAEQRGETTMAIRHYLDAARLYFPGNPFARDALDRLDSIAVAAVIRGDYATARSAFEAERAAILGTRAIFTANGKRLPDIERRLARLLAAEEAPAAAATFKERAAWHAERLSERPGVKTSWFLLALLGLVTWVTSAILFFLRGLDPRLGLKRGPAALAAMGFVVGLSLFLVFLRLA